jgi:hypothetical protein
MVDAATIACLAGVNTAKHSVQSLVWLYLGGHLPKDKVSLGDNIWDFPFKELPQALQLYLRGDTTQLALAVWVLLCCWVAHMFTDLHAVFKVSRAQSAGNLLHWWVSEVVEPKLWYVRQIPPWSPVTSRDQVPSALGINQKFGDWSG